MFSLRCVPLAKAALFLYPGSFLFLIPAGFLMMGVRSMDGLARLRTSLGLTEGFVFFVLL